MAISLDLIIGDHPRVCGEHDSDSESFTNFKGSSPRMRGSTRPRPIRHPCAKDHPRVCGEHGEGYKDKDGRPGSSPRMRGARRQWRGHGSTPGIIPAYAGSTLRPKSCTVFSTDHPRVCGEHPTPRQP